MASGTLSSERLSIGRRLGSLATSRAALDAVGRGLAAAVLVAMSFVAFRLFNGADTPFLAYAFAGGLLVHAIERPSVKEMAATAAIAIFLALGYNAGGGRYGD